MAHFAGVAPRLQTVTTMQDSNKTGAERREYELAIRPHVPELFGTAMRLTRSRSAADDLLQDTMARAWTFWHRFRKGSNARAWMHRILMNTFINGYRKQKREREVLSQLGQEVRLQTRDAVTELEQRRKGDGFSDEVSAALEGIRPEFRAVVELVDVGDLSYQEAADRLQCPIGTIMSRLHRGRKALRAQLRDYAAQEGLLAVA